MDHNIIGVDMHKANHIAVAINVQGARLGTMTIAANEDGCRRLNARANGLGRVTAFGIEGTGSYGAGLWRDLQARGHTVLDVMRPNRQLRYLHGKSDSLDAEGAAWSVLNGQATAIAKSQDRTSEMIRHLKLAKDSAVKAKS
jgi:transposase